MSDAERKAQEQNMRPTDIAPVGRRSAESLTVKVDLVAGNTHAHITTKDGRINMFVPSGMILKRKIITSGFFKAQIKDGVGVVEIGERVDLPKEKQW